MPSGEPDPGAVQATAVRVGVLADAEVGRALRHGLERFGLEVERLPALPGGLQALQSSRAQVFLVDIEDATDTVLDALEQLLESAPGPVLVNESGRAEQNGVWMKRLAGKLLALGGPGPGAAPAQAAVDSQATPSSAAPPDLPMVWVLGASFGGPEAVRRFFAALPGRPDTTFFLAQHIGDGFVDLLASQLGRTTALKVVSVKAGMRIQTGVVYVVPVREVVRIDEDGVVRLERDVAERSCRPCIDMLMEEVANRYGARAGGILFSGMGDDGTLGARAIAAAGGVVWAQDKGSASVSSMPDCAAATGAVSRRGTPEELARGLASFLEHDAVTR